jgi:hypothetical protein
LEAEAAVAAAKETIRALEEIVNIKKPGWRKAA